MQRKKPVTKNKRLAARIILKYGSPESPYGYVPFANALGCSEQNVCFHVGQHRRLPSNQKKKWAKLLDCDVLDLWKHE